MCGQDVRCVLAERKLVKRSGGGSGRRFGGKAVVYRPGLFWGWWRRVWLWVGGSGSGRHKGVGHKR